MLNSRSYQDILEIKENKNNFDDGKQTVQQEKETNQSDRDSQKKNLN